MSLFLKVVMTWIDLKKLVSEVTNQCFALDFRFWKMGFAYCVLFISYLIYKIGFLHTLFYF